MTTIDTAAFVAARFRDLGPDEWIEARTFHPDGAPGPRFWERDPARFARKVLALPAGLAVYYGVSPRRKNGGKKQHVTSITTLWADVDFKHFGDDPEAARAALEDFPLPPTWLIDSGGGLQAYWQLADPLPIASPTDPAISTVEGLLSRLYARLGGLDSVQDVSRVLRVPGSMNHKYDPPRPVTIIAHHPDATYTLDDFAAILPAPEPAPAPFPTHPPRNGDAPPIEQVEEMLRCIPPQPGYHKWMSLLASVHSAYPGPEGIAACEHWSPGKPGEVAAKFKSFGNYRGQRGPTTIGSLIYEARQYGYQPPAPARPHGPPATAAAPADLLARVAELEREVARKDTLIAQRDTALAHCQAEHVRKDATIAELRAEVRAHEATGRHHDQTVGGAVWDIAEAVAASYRRGDVLVHEGREYARVVIKQAAKRRSAQTVGRAVKAITAAHPANVITREELIETATFKGRVPITYVYAEDDQRRHPAGIVLALLPPPAEKRHGGSEKRIAVPPEVAGQPHPVRRERREVARFYSVVDDTRLGALESPPVIDYCTADGVPLTMADVARFQVEIGARPPAPPRYAPPVQRRFQDGAIGTKETGFQDGIGAADPSLPVEPPHNRGCRVPSCGSPPTRDGYCDLHHFDHWGSILRGHPPGAADFAAAGD